jgi:GNAT superfamily N-acetyltransferase
VSVSVRPASEEDFGTVTALLEELGRAEVTDATRDECRRIFAAHLDDPSASHLVAADGEAVIGFCSLHFRDRLNFPTPDAWVPDLIVTAHARRRGAARALLREAERLAYERGCWRLTLESGYERVEAHRLYEAVDMEDAGKYFQKFLG